MACRITFFTFQKAPASGVLLSADAGGPKEGVAGQLGDASHSPALAGKPIPDTAAKLTIMGLFIYNGLQVHCKNRRCPGWQRYWSWIWKMKSSCVR